MPRGVADVVRHVPQDPAGATSSRTSARTGYELAALLEVRHVTRRFAGLVAVNDVSFTLEPGEILGVIGPNGAGKTTSSA